MKPCAIIRIKPHSITYLAQILQQKKIRMIALAIKYVAGKVRRISIVRLALITENFKRHFWPCGNV